MADSPQRREDARREWTMWCLVAADANGISVSEAADRIEAAFVGPMPARTQDEVSPWYVVPRFEDHLPEPAAWNEHASRVRASVRNVEEHLSAIDEQLRTASPRWRIERMPMIDRALLRMGVAELAFREKPRPRATLNGLIELAKRYGQDSTPRFVNGILDQVRRNLGVPFS